VSSESTFIRPEQSSDAPRIESLQHLAFGPGAFARAAFRVREQAPHDPALSFVTERAGELIGSVRLTPIVVGDAGGLLLGPLVVNPTCKGLGFGKALVRHALQEAERARHAFVLLVGDEPYYGPLGFARIPAGRVKMPGPVDPARLLVAELRPGSTADLQGLVRGRAPGAGWRAPIPTRGGHIRRMDNVADRD
jgi:predicted N-acetyltransferase YhbS